MHSKYICAVRSRGGPPKAHKYGVFVKVAGKRTEIRCSWCYKLRR